ncbi:MAG: hypothetical protein MZW92_31720 [Comamonadaceae bacterium]|nr:hypothetical protein [Comamonadaceae bacterium]
MATGNSSSWPAGCATTAPRPDRHAAAQRHRQLHHDRRRALGTSAR